MSGDYVPPESQKNGFHCPNCGMYAHQQWEDLLSKNRIKGAGATQILNGYIGICTNCWKPTIWSGEELIYPATSTAPQPHEDMPDAVKKDFTEAREVVETSPRAAAALLRLAMEKLCQQLTEEENLSLHENIGKLLEEGLIDERIQKALDSVRVTGNDMVHPGEIYDDDDKEAALRLFDLVNTIIRLTITQEKLIDDAYSEIPEEKLEGIEQRDER